MIERLLLFGASGDLAGRFLLPALAALRAAGRLPEGFRVVGAARQEWSDAEFRRHAARKLERHAADVPAAAREALVRVLSYRPVDLEDAGSVSSVAAVGSGPVAAYLALPPALFPAAVRALADAGLPRGSRIVLEKPFGEDLESAIELNRLLARTVGATAERAVFRVDHALGMASVQNLLAMRLANPVLEAVWDGAHVEAVEILWEETLALEGRAGYYDTAGALEDVMQNHMLQVASLIAMELPSAPGADALRDRKVEALRSLRPPRRDEMASRTRRARYAAGRLAGSGREVPAYADEEGVDPARGTETFAEVTLELGGERWGGTPLLLRAGKALRRDRLMAILRFRRAARGWTGGGAPELRIELETPEEIELRLTGGAPGAPRPLRLAGRPPSDLPPYGRVLLDVLEGGSTLSVSGAEAEEAWRVVTPVVDAWAEGRVPLEEYPPASDGPGPRPPRATSDPR